MFVEWMDEVKEGKAMPRCKTIFEGRSQVSPPLPGKAIVILFLKKIGN